MVRFKVDALESDGASLNRRFPMDIVTKGI